MEAVVFLMTVIGFLYWFKRGARPSSARTGSLDEIHRWARELGGEHAAAGTPIQASGWFADKGLAAFRAPIEQGFITEADVAQAYGAYVTAYSAYTAEAGYAASTAVATDMDGDTV